MKNKVVIFSDEKGWHTRKLQEEFYRRGIKTRCVDLANCSFEIKNNLPTIIIPGFGNELPKFAIVRGISGGSLEQITKRLDILHLLSAHGVTVVNKASSIEKSVDKGMTSFLLKKNNIPTPPFWVTESITKAQKIIANSILSGNKIVLKPVFGSQGQGLKLFGGDHKCEYSDLSRIYAKGEVFYLQQFVPLKNSPSSYDYRVFVVKNNAIAAMKRVGKTWIHNRAMGANCEKCYLHLTLKKIAEKAAKILDLDIAGVDLIPDASVAEGFQVIEVNGIPAWKGIQSVSEFNVTTKMVDLLIGKQVSPF